MIKETKSHASNACNVTAQSMIGIINGCNRLCMALLFVMSTAVLQMQSCAWFGISANIHKIQHLMTSDLLLQFLHALTKESICAIIDAICCCQHLGDLSMSELRELLLQHCNLVFKKQVLQPGRTIQFSLMIRHYMLHDLKQQLSRC